MKHSKVLSRCLLITAILSSWASWGANNLADQMDYSGSIRLSVDRWLAVQRPSGFFPYGFDFLMDKEMEPNALSGPNLVRQAGTASALADYYLLTGDKRARPALEKLLTAFEGHSLPIGKSSLQGIIESSRLLSMPIGRYKIQSALDRLGLLYKTEGEGKVLSPNNDYRQARTGGLALALLTEVRYFKASGDHRFAPLRKAWLEGLLGLRIPDGGFRVTPSSIDSTPYFDGEAWLALAEYNNTFPQDHRAAQALADLDDDLITMYGKSGSAYKIAFFHWGTMAAAARYSHSKEQKFLDFIHLQMREFLKRKEKFTDTHNNCASIEGAADALGVMTMAGEASGELGIRTRNWIDKQMSAIQRMQIQPGQRNIVFSNAHLLAPRLQEFAGAYLGGIYRAETRVDFAQHCVSAMIKKTRSDTLRR